MRALIILCLLGCTALATAFSEIRTATLPNGISYYIWPAGKAERACLQLVLPIGSVHEEEHERGLAHLVEHLMFRGTASYSQAAIMEFLSSIHAQIGPDANAYTRFDHTVYILEVPATDLSAIATGLKIIRGWITDATLKHRDIEEERSIVLEEWRAQLGQEAQIFEDNLQLIFADSRYAKRLPIGLPEVISSASPNTIRQFYNRWYLNAPAAIIVTGAVDGDAVEELICSQFSSLSQMRSWEHVPSFPIPSQSGIRAKILSNPSSPDNYLQVLVTQENNTVDSPASPHRSLLHALYYTLLQQRLDSLKETEVAIVSNYYPIELTNNTTTHCIEVAFRQGDFLWVTDQLASILNRLFVEGFIEQELQYAKEILRLAFSMSQATGEDFDPRQLAQLCQQNFLKKGLLPDSLSFSEMLLMLEELALEDLNRFSSEIDYVHHGLILGMLNNSAEEELPTLETLQTVWNSPLSELSLSTGSAIPSNLQLMATPPACGMVMATSMQEPLGLLTWHLSNGMRVHLLPKPHSLYLTLWGVANGGLMDLPSDQLLAGRLASETLAQSGIGPYSPQELDRRLGTLYVDLTRSITPLSRHLSGSCSAATIEQFFQMIHLTFTEQQIRHEAFEQTRSNQLREVAHVWLNPHAIFEMKSLEINYANHPLFMMPSAKELRDIQYDDVARICIQAFSNPKPFDLFFVGDVEVGLFSQLIERYLATIPKFDRKHTPVRELNLSFSPQVKIERIIAGNDPESQVQFTFPVALTQSSPEDLATAYLVADLIGSRIQDLIRNRLSATYSVSSQLTFIYPDLNSGRLVIRFTCHPEDAEILSLITLRALGQLSLQGPLETEVELHKQQALRQLRRSEMRNEFWSAALGRHAEFGWDLQALTNPSTLYLAITIDSARAMITQMLPLDRYTLMMSFPK